ncbi:hypothetical protein VTJ04DRAFT_4732 [Mycothermus thermophilus]|uniref:uncharacterized protein n=1 Tax=Humicola insolens TaxID=85995 RepID=UPI0037427A1E
MQQFHSARICCSSAEGTSTKISATYGVLLPTEARPPASWGPRTVPFGTGTNFRVAGRDLAHAIPNPKAENTDPPAATRDGSGSMQSMANRALPWNVRICLPET